MWDCVLPIPREVAKLGWRRLADTGNDALSGNRIPAGKATIVARHVAVLAALQINFEVLAEWGAYLAPRRLEVRRLHFVGV